MTYRIRMDTRFKSSVERTPRVLEVAEAFGLGLSDKDFVVFDNLEFDIEFPDVIYITGQSGSGKSLLLRGIEQQLRDVHGLTVANIDTVELDPDKPLIDQLGTSAREAMYFMNLAGLTDAYLWLRKPSELSDGQKYRLRIAKLMESGTQVWIADEFGAILDRTTAKVIAFDLQKLARERGVIAAVATTHTDLKEDLHPSLIFEKYYRERLHVSRSEVTQP